MNAPTEWIICRYKVENVIGLAELCTMLIGELI